MGLKRNNKIDQYISHFNPDIQQRLMAIRETIAACIDDGEEVISYNIPTFRNEKNIVHFAGYDCHIGFYPTPDVIREFQRKLTEYASSKGVIKFPHDKELPLALIEEMTKYRLHEMKQV